MSYLEFLDLIYFPIKNRPKLKVVYFSTIKNWPFVTENVLCIQTNTDDIVALLWYLKPFGWVLLNEVPFELMSFMYAVKRVLEQKKMLNQLIREGSIISLWYEV